MTPRLTTAAVTVLLLAEGLVLGTLFHTQVLHRLGESWWARLVAHASDVPHLAVAVVTGVAIFGARRVSQAFVEMRAAPRGRRWPWLLVHAVAAAAFFLSSRRLLGQGETGWIVPWLVAGAASVAALIPTAIGPHALAALLRRTWPVLAAGAAVGVGAWAAGELAEQRLWRPLQLGTLLGAHRLVRLVREDAFIVEGDMVLGLPGFVVTVDPACAGYEGMGLALVFLAGVLVAFRRELRFPRALLLLPLGMAAVWVGNLLRVAGLVLVGTVSPAVAVGGFHSYAGSVLFCLLVFAVVQAGRRWRWMSQRAPEAVAPVAAPGPGAEPFLVPLLAVLAAALLTGVLGAGALDWWYPVRPAVAGLALYWYRRELLTLLTRPSALSVGLGLLVAAIWLALAPAEPARDTRLAGELAAAPPAAAGAWLLARAAGAVAMAPVVEELAFRGYLLRRLGSADFRSAPYPRRPGLALVASSVAFGLLHGELWLAGALAGAVYGLAAGARGRLGDAVVAHATTNLFLVIWGTARGRWSLWF